LGKKSGGPRGVASPLRRSGARFAPVKRAEKQKRGGEAHIARRGRRERERDKRKRGGGGRERVEERAAPRARFFNEGQRAWEREGRRASGRRHTDLCVCSEEGGAERPARPKEKGKREKSFWRRSLGKEAQGIGDRAARAVCMYVRARERALCASI
jgi:hypothetical protein